MNKGIIVAGSIIVDSICEINKFPEKGNLVDIVNVNKALGGLVPNVSIDLKRIDKSLTIFACGVLGNDEYGKYVLSELKNENIDTHLIKIKEDQITSFDNVMSKIKGERTFFVYSGANDSFNEQDIELNENQVSLLHLGYFLLMKKLDDGDGVKILKKAKEKGIVTSIDLVSDENIDKYKKIIPCLKYVDYLIINEIEASRLTSLSLDAYSIKQIITKLKNLGVNQKVIIHSPKKSYLYDGKEYIEQESFKLDKKYIKGTTGAGDAFCAGALYQIYKEKNNKEILEFATMCAAKSLGSNDATSAMVSKEEIIDFCNKF